MADQNLTLSITQRRQEIALIVQVMAGQGSGSITKEAVEAVLIGNISTHTHSQYLSAITKAMVEAVLTGDISSHTHSAYLSAITSLMVTNALGFTPYNSSNPSGFINGITKLMVEAVLTGNISSHTHAAYLTAINKAMVEAVLTGDISTHTHSSYVTGTPWTLMGYLTAITSLMVTNALGFTPYNATNPSGFITAINKAMVEAVLTGNISTHTHSYQPIDGDLTAIAALAGTSGILKKTAVDTWVLDTSAYITAINKAMVEAVLTGNITTHTHPAGGGITKGDVEAVLTGDISTHTHSQYLTAISSLLVTTALGFTPYNATNPSGFIASINKAMVEAVLTGDISTHTHSSYVTGTPWTLMGYLTAITSLMVTNALGFTPYNATNPSGFISSINKAMVEAVLTGDISTHTHSSYLSKDANQNISANNLLEGFSTIATAGGTTTLVIGSAYNQIFTGTLAQTVVLPTTGLGAGHPFFITNLSTGSVTVQSSGLNTIVILAPGTAVFLTAQVATPTTAAHWSFLYIGDVVASGKKLTVSNSLTLSGTDGTTMTFPTTSNTLAANDGSNMALASQAIGDLMSASSSTAYARIAAVAVGSVLISKGTGVAPAWSTIPLVANLIEGFTTTATAGGTTTLVYTSNFLQFFTGTLAQTITLPTTSVIAGQGFQINNLSSQSITVQSSGANTIVVLAPGTFCQVQALVATPTTAAHWQLWYEAVIAVSGKKLTVNNTLTLAGTDGTTMTFPASSDTVVARTSTDTLTNKRVTKRTLALSANSATPAINTDNYDVVHITAQSAAITSMTSGLTGTPVDGDELKISITGSTSIAITWGASFEGYLLPSTTSGTLRMDMEFKWNTETSKWKCHKINSGSGFADEPAEFKNTLTITGGTAIDWSTGFYAEITLSGNTTYTFTNIEQGKSILLEMTGSFVPTFPSGCTVVNGGTYTGAKKNDITIVCVNSSTPKFKIYINTEP